MTFDKIISAIPALQELGKEKIPLREAYKLSKLRAEIDEHLKFFTEERDKIICESQNEDERQMRLKELLNFDVNITKRHLNLSDILISCESLERLEGLVDIEVDFEEV